MKRTEFERVTPESVGISSEGISRFVDSLETGYTDMHGLMIMRHGKICTEGWWAPFAPGLHHMCNSLTKSYMGTAIGVAYTEGLLKLDDRLIDIFPEYTPENPSPYIDDLTVRNVLCMGTGMKSFPSMEGEGGWVKNFIGHEIVDKPGTTYYYNSVGSTFLGKIILKLTGKDVYTYLNEKVFTKIGIDGSNIDHGIAPDGKDMWAWRTVSCTEDNLRLMKLYADGGIAPNGERILAEDYVKLATTNQNDSASEAINNPGADDNYVGYGFQIWMCQYPGAYRADGAGGQFSIVIPDKDMIVSINESARKPQKTLDNVWKYLMPAVMDDVLPENEEAAEALKSRMKHLAIAAPDFAPYSKRKVTASGKYVLTQGNFDLYANGMMTPGAAPTEWFEINFDTMEGSIKWVAKDRQSCSLEFAMNGQRRFNKFASPWQFATECWANGLWDGDVFKLELLWPENNASRTFLFIFGDDEVEIQEQLAGPAMGRQKVATKAVRK